MVTEQPKKENNEEEITFEKIIKRDPLGEMIWNTLFLQDNSNNIEIKDSDIETEYYDLDVFNTYSLLITLEDNYEKIVGITDNLIDTHYFLKNLYINHYFKINYDNIEKLSEVSFNKCLTTDNHLYYNCNSLSNNPLPSISYSIFIIYTIVEKKICPIQLFKSIEYAEKYIESFSFHDELFLVELKINKIYDSVYLYEYISLIQK